MLRAEIKISHTINLHVQKILEQKEKFCVWGVRQFCSCCKYPPSVGNDVAGSFLISLRTTALVQLHLSTSFLYKLQGSFYDANNQGWEFAHQFFDSLIFCERKSDSLMKKSKSLPSLFCHDHEQPERIAHGRSSVMSDLSELLRLLFCKEPQEQIDQVAVYQRANEGRATGVKSS